MIEDQLDRQSVKIALQMQQKYRLGFDAMYALADYLEEQPKVHEQHLIQIAVKWCRGQPKS